jgi:hypothetical protein
VCLHPEYSEDFSFELARSSSAAPQRRFSSSVWLAGIGPQFYEILRQNLGADLSRLSKNFLAKVRGRNRRIIGAKSGGPFSARAAAK